MTQFDFQQKIHRILSSLEFFGVWRDLTKPSEVVGLIIVMSLFNVFTVLQIVNAFLIYGDAQKIALQVLVLLTDLFVNVKIYFLLKYRGSILKLSGIANQASFQPKNRKQEGVVRYRFALVDFMYYAFKVFPTMTISIFAVYPLVSSPELRRLPLHAWYPYDYTKAEMVVFVPTFLHGTLNQLWGTHIYANIDCLHFTLLAVIITQFDMLSDNLRSVFEVGTSGKRSSEEVKEYFVSLVTHHKEIVAFFEEVYRVLNISIFVQFASTTSALCLLLLQLSTIQMGTEFVAIIFFVGTFLSELLFYCWWGTQVIAKSESLPSAIYESNWIGQPKQVKKDIMFLIQRTQTPTVIRAVDFFRMDLPTFLMVVRLSYSCFTVIHHMNG